MSPNLPADSNESTQTSRRDFIKTAGVAVAAAAVGPTILHADDKAGSKAPVIGSGEHQYECIHDWGQVPDHIKWGNTHGVCVDKQGLIYIKHQSTAKEPVDAIAVFDADGKFVRSFGKEYHGGGHGIDLREENGEEFLYLSDTHNRQVVKTNLKGEHVWELSYPKEANVYQSVEGFRPTNVCFGNDGDFYVGDGYGSSYIHQYNKDAKWIRTWGGKGEQKDVFSGGEGSEAGKMSTPHGLWLDARTGREPSLAVCDRGNARLQYFTLDGQHVSFLKDVLFPGNIDIQNDVMLVADLFARVSLFDAKNQPIVHLGDDEAWRQQVVGENRSLKMRTQREQWQPGKFIHPHDACFDHAGNIFVVEWVPTGRVTFLRKVA